MSLYSISLFLHVAGALALFAVLSLEAAGVLGLRGATTAGQAREWTKLLQAPRFGGGPAALTVLLTGIHLGATRWGWQGWIVVGLAAMVTIAALGPALGARRFAAIGRALATAEGPITPVLGRLLHEPVLVFSIYLRGALFLGIVFLMATKPGAAGALAAIVVALVLGLAAGVPKRNAGLRAGDPALETSNRDR